jgi:hypothetical protein
MSELYSTLILTLVAEDADEDAGCLAADDRRTCHTCQTWATPEHVTSAEHRQTIDVASRRVTDAEMAEVACMATVPDYGKCLWPLPCPDHALTLDEGLALAASIDARDGTHAYNVLRTQVKVRLSWPSAQRRWSIWDIPCQYCNGATHVLDQHGIPTHPACAEVVLARQIAGGEGSR